MIVQGQTIRENYGGSQSNLLAGDQEIRRWIRRKRDPGMSKRSIYMPLAADASWQKFAVIWGGNILIDKRRTKAPRQELNRCNWQGDDLRWEISTGKTILLNAHRKNCQMSMCTTIFRRSGAVDP